MNYHLLHFDEETFKYLGGETSPRFGSNRWEKHEIEPSQVISDKLLTHEILTQKRERGPRATETTTVHLCYNWKLKVEFVLVGVLLETTEYHYTPQYGKDDNYPKSIRRDYQYLAYSVEAFQRLKPRLARCLQKL